MNILNRFLPPLLSFAILIFGALQVAMQNGLEPVEVVQLTPLAAGAVVTYFLPLLQGRWAGALKTGMALVAALAVAIVPFATVGFISPEGIIIVVLAVLNALATEIGVQVRQTAALIDARDTNVITSLPDTTVAAAGADEPALAASGVRVLQ